MAASPAAADAAASATAGGGGGGGGRRRRLTAVAAAAVDSAAAALAAAAFALAAARGGGMPPQVVGEGKGVVKFFNPQKGFGFIVRDDGGEDVFVHISAVEQAGLTDLADGQPLEFTLVDRGGRISATNLRIEGEPMAVERSSGGRRRRRRRPAAAADRREGSGTVKFFNAMKGFGFIQRDDGQPDAFVHISRRRARRNPDAQRGRPAGVRARGRPPRQICRGEPAKERQLI